MAHLHLWVSHGLPVAVPTIPEPVESLNEWAMQGWLAAMKLPGSHGSHGVTLAVKKKVNRKMKKKMLRYPRYLLGLSKFSLVQAPFPNAELNVRAQLNTKVNTSGCV